MAPNISAGSNHFVRRITMLQDRNMEQAPNSARDTFVNRPEATLHTPGVPAQTPLRAPRQTAANDNAPNVTPPPAPTHYTSASKHILVTLQSSVNRAQKLLLEGAGAVIQEYVGDETYLCAFYGTDTYALSALPFVTQVSSIPPSHKLSSALRDGTAQVSVCLHDDITLTDELAHEIANAAHLDVSELHDVGCRIIRVEVAHEYLLDIARIDAVRVIEPVPVYKIPEDSW